MPLHSMRTNARRRAHFFTSIGQAELGCDRGPQARMRDTLHFYRVPGTAAARLDMSIQLVLSGVSGCCIWSTTYSDDAET